MGKECKYKFFLIGINDGIGNVGILWANRVIKVVIGFCCVLQTRYKNDVCDRIIENSLVHSNIAISVYAPYAGLGDEQNCF